MISLNLFKKLIAGKIICGSSVDRAMRGRKKDVKGETNMASETEGRVITWIVPARRNSHKS